MKKVLFLTKSYPNISKSASVLCTKRLIEYMSCEPDFEVHCLCTKVTKEKDDEFENSVFIHRMNKTLWKSLVDSMIEQPRLQSLMLKVQKFLTGPFFPSSDPFMLRRYVFKSIELQNRFNFDIVITEHHEYATLMAGIFLKKKYPSIKFYPILWDPILGQTLPKYLPSFFVMKRIEKCENLVNETADYIFSILAAKSIYAKFKDTSNGKRIYFDIPGILPPANTCETKYLSLLKEGYINVVFSGLVGAPLRDPAYILNLFNNSKYAEKLNVVFFCKGIKESDKKLLMKNFVGNLTFNNYIPLEELYTIYRHADFLLNISNINPNMTPSKIFEYMSYGKPIISTYITDGDSAKKYLGKYPEAIVIDQKTNFEHNIEMLDHFLEGGHQIVTFEIVKEKFQLNTPEGFVNIIRKIDE